MMSNSQRSDERAESPEAKTSNAQEKAENKQPFGHFLQGMWSFSTVAIFGFLGPVNSPGPAPVTVCAASPSLFLRGTI
jgi:hypothetical protein